MVGSMFKAMVVNWAVFKALVDVIKAGPMFKALVGNFDVPAQRNSACFGTFRGNAG